jgi:hypothetical protein
MLTRAILFGSLAALLCGSASVPRFEDYPSGKVFRGTPARPRFSTGGQRMFQTVIQDAVRQGPNFAGRFTLAEWGCGTGCVSVAVVEATTGVVYEGPFGRLPRGSIYLGPPPDPELTGLFFRRDSRLLVASGCPNRENCGTYYCEWLGNRFRLIMRTPIGRRVRESVK